MCSGPNGTAEIQAHPFYKSIEWKKMMFKQVKAPFVPKGEDNIDPSLQQEGIEPPQGKGSATKLDFGDFTYAQKSIVD